MDNEDKPLKVLGPFTIGQSLEALSVHELHHVRALLEQETQRVGAEIAKKQHSRALADSFFGKA